MAVVLIGSFAYAQYSQRMIDDIDDLDPIPDRIHIAKTRTCLKCNEPFESRWAGERVCRRCKGSHDWRERVASTPDYGVHRRR